LLTVVFGLSVGTVTTSVLGLTLLLTLLRLERRGRARLTCPRWLRASGRCASSRLLRLLERVEAPLDRGHTAVERIDRAQLRRDVVEPLGYPVKCPDDDATREAEEPPERVLACVGEL
jgi:hypothetical protein